LPQNVQYKAFAPTPPGSRKVILATNIAETSVTVPGVRFVIDPGLQKRRKFNAQLGIETLQIYPISKSSAAQRTGRAGREAPGKCFRLYPSAHFSSLAENTTPEIRDCDLTSLVLTLKIHGHDDILNFPFLDRPKRESVIRSLEILYLLGALGNDGKPTELGRQMNLLPLTPELAKVLLSSAKGEVNCAAEVIDIIACMTASTASSNAIFLTPNAERREESAENRKHFASAMGDHITLLQAFREYQSILKSGGQGSGAKEWCQKWGVNRRVLKNVMEVQKQLLGYCHRNSISVTPAERADKDAILRAFLSGYIMNTAILQQDGSYRTTFSHHVTFRAILLMIDCGYTPLKRSFQSGKPQEN
jgi:ATP-dependent RNA helicase DHR2